MPGASTGSRRGHGTGPAVLGALSVAAVLLVPAATVGAERTPPHRVVIDGLRYEPETLVVHPGETVVWVNKDPFPHTITAAGAFDSGSLGAGRSWRFVARRVGVFPYVCSLHSNMKGTLRVE